MVLKASDIDKIAALAKLKPTGKERERLLADLNKVLEYMEIINELETEKTAEMSHPRPDNTPLRADRIRPGLSHEDAVKNAPVVKDGLFAVPKVIENPKS